MPHGWDLDDVELCLAIEDQFRLVLPMTDSPIADTVGATAALVYAQLRKHTDDPCPSQQGFYLIRSTLMKQLGLSRDEIKPDTKLEGLFPTEHRRRHWNTFAQAVAPESGASALLVRPSWLNLLVVGLVPTVAFFAPLYWLPWSPFWLGIFPALLVLFLGDALTTAAATHFPSDCNTVRDCVPWVKTLNCEIWTETQVLEKIQTVAAYTLAIDPALIKASSRWIEDLGVDG